MKLKSLEEFLNESYTGSMSSIIVKMKNEMKSAQTIYSYLFTLGVDPIRIQEEMRKHAPYAVEFSSEYKINSDKHKNPAGFPGPSGRMTGVNESDINEASRFKGKEIYPDWVTPKDIKGMIRNVKDLTVGAQYALLDLGMDAWQAEYEYKGKVGSKHLFKSTAQGTDSGSDLEYTDKELKDAVSSVEVALMESKENLEEKFKIEKDPSGNYKWAFKIASYDDSKTYDMLTSKGYKELNNAGVEFGTSAQGMWVMGDTEADKKKAIKVLKSLGITESFMNEEGDLEAELDSLEADLEKTSDEVKDKETTEEPSSQPETEKKEDALKSAISDIEKLDKIRKILAESFDIEGVEDEVIENVIDYHVEEKMSTEEKSKLKDTDFIFPEEKSWPIHDEKHAKTALVWATWPQNKEIKEEIVKAVLKKYPKLKGYGAAK